MKNAFRLFLLFQFTSLFGWAQWNSGPAINTSICSGILNSQKNVATVSDLNGGAIIAWEDYRNDSLTSHIYMQRVDKYGVTKWAVNGMRLCALDSSQVNIAMVSDSLGGVIISWQDSRGDSNAGADIYAQRVDSSGNLLWTPNGVAIAAKLMSQKYPSIVSDNNHGAIIVWQDATLNNSWDIYAQRIGSNGSTVWTTGGVVICNDVNKQISPKLTVDGTGGAFICWQDYRNTVDYDIYAQRIDGVGTVHWSTNGVAICNATDTQKSPKIKSDNQGGAILVWQDKRNGLDYDIYSQRVNATGTMQWSSNGVVICNAINGQQNMSITTAGINGAIIAWSDGRIDPNNEDVYAQRIALNGAVAWSTNGIAIANAVYTQNGISIAGDRLGGAFIAWQDSCCGSWDIKAQRIDANGVALWSAGGVATGAAALTQSNVDNLSDDAGGCIFVFQDKRSGNYDIYAHHLNSNGTTAGIIEETKSDFHLQIAPNPFAAHSTIQCDTQLQDATLTVVTIFGQKIIEQKNINGQSVDLDRGELSAGVYFVHLSMGNRVAVEKIIVTD